MQMKLDVNKGSRRADVEEESLSFGGGGESSTMCAEEGEKVKEENVLLKQKAKEVDMVKEEIAKLRAKAEHNLTKHKMHRTIYLPKNVEGHRVLIQTADGAWVANKK